jgi:hypothetical protein
MRTFSLVATASCGFIQATEGVVGDTMMLPRLSASLRSSPSMSLPG